MESRRRRTASARPHRAARGPRPAGAAGQASLELLAGLPLLLALGVGLAQLLAVGYSAVLAANAAEAGALAIAGGANAAASARRALPGWSRAGARVIVDGGAVTVRVRPPALMRSVSRALEVQSTARVAR